MECSHRNGRIDGYRLTINSSDNERIVIDGSNTNTFTIVGLQPSSDYTLILEAVSGNYSLYGNESRMIISTLMPEGNQFSNV